MNQHPMKHALSFTYQEMHVFTVWVYESGKHVTHKRPATKYTCKEAVGNYDMLASSRSRCTQNAEEHCGKFAKRLMEMGVVSIIK